MKDEKIIVWKKIIVIAFFLMLFGFGVVSVILPDKAVSKQERRTLAKKPELSFETVIDGSYMKKLETYFLEQFAGREQFRKIKTETETKIFQKKDSGDYYRIEDGLFKLDAMLQEKNITRAAAAFMRVKKTAFPKANVYFSVIPDKNYFVAEEYGYPTYDYNRLEELMQDAMQESVYIDIYELLELSDYYKTDLHWKQECIVDVSEELLKQMRDTDETVLQNIEDTSEAYPAKENRLETYEIHMATEMFLGGYAGASAFQSKPEKLQYLTNAAIEQAICYDYETQKEQSVYSWEKLDGIDAYDFYLGGARALLTITNPLNQNGKQLLLFRDSFGSSIAPLLLEEYEVITLVDFRYISENYLLELLDMSTYDDVLFLYSTTVLNHSDSMKIN